MDDTCDIGGLGQHFRKLAPAEQSIRLAAFYRILEGGNPSVDELGFLVGMPSEHVRMHIRGLVQRGILVTDEQGTVVGSHGLSLIPTQHSLTINGQSLFTWCAADAVGIPAALGTDAKIESSCFQCKKPIEITFDNGRVRYSNQVDIRIWVVEADLGKPIVGCA